MKQIIMIFTILITLPSLAGTMCAINDTVAVVLDGSINVSNNGRDNGQFVTWWARMQYHTLRGTSACLSKPIGATYKFTSVLLKDKNSNGENKLVVGGERNGNYCWCRLQHPVVSKWMFERQYSDCATSCANYCALYFGRFSNYTGLVFDSIEY